MIKQSRELAITVILIALTLPFIGCDRGANVQIEAAKKFADAITKNNAAVRDSMIATHKFKEYFQNVYVTNDMITWFRTFYDYQQGKFIKPASADVDRDLRKDLEGGLITSDSVEDTGIVKVKSPFAGEPTAIFWMVKQTNQPWKVAIVTKGEMQVLFR